ncbi:ZN136-like protein [Mya arenaria]|uniref:ZN136-like protein n=1 Tax=Mya arenaria TaxID=6604 RepID=A0ABY7EC22_MYAAR|nr:ZN136-like protein [Mya arenaria]
MSLPLSYKHDGDIEQENINKATEAALNGSKAAETVQSGSGEQSCNEEISSEASYRCGACPSVFHTLCCLHKHLEAHGCAGSFIFNHSIKTAYPQFEMVSISIQTDVEESNEIDLVNVSAIKQEKVEISDKCDITVKETKPFVKRKVKEQKLKKKTVKKDYLRLKMKKKKKYVKKIKEYYSDKDDNLSNCSNETEDYDMDSSEGLLGLGIKSEGFEAKYDANIVRMDPYENALEIDEEDGEKPVKSKKVPKLPGEKRLRKKIQRSYGGEDGKVHCVACNAVFECEREANAHHRKTHPSDERKNEKRLELKENGSYECRICGEEFKFFYKAKKHVKSSHPNKAKACNSLPMECRWCGETFETATICYHHTSSCEHHPKFSCQICGERAETLEELNVHLVVHSNSDNLSCMVCRKAFTNVHYMQRHMLKHNTQKVIQCEHCGKAYSTDRALTHHRKQCTVEETIPCPHCNKMFKTDHSLKLHLMVHTEERPFVCHICGFALKKASYLKRHIRTHTGEKPYKCVDCGMMFSTLNGINRRYCGKSFTTNWNLKTHLRQHTGDTPYQCGLCGKAFKQNVLLKLHNKTHHPTSYD